MELIVFDLDGVLVKYRDSEYYSSWGAIGNALGLRKESDELLNYYLPRKKLYKEWFLKNVKLFEGKSVKKVAEKIFPPPYPRGVKKTMKILNEKYKTGILSGGVDLVADYIKEDLKMEFAISNRVGIKDGYFDGTGEHVIELQGKGKKLKEISKEMGINLEDVCFVGDHENDIPAFNLAGLSIAFQPKNEKVKKAANFSANDFAEILNIIKKWDEKKF